MTRPSTIPAYYLLLLALGAWIIPIPAHGQSADCWNDARSGATEGRAALKAELTQAEYRGVLASNAIPPAPSVASYDIDARLSGDGKLIYGQEVVRYRNASEHTLDELYLHLYLNAFRSTDTIWMRETGAQHRGFAFDADATGYIEIESIMIGGQQAALTVEEDGTIGRLPLPEHLAPARELELTIQWTSHLPRVFARTGWAPGGFTMAGQWYPKLAVYDPRRDGWDREPWHANAEFFHDFGNYNLTLTVPSERAVAATGKEVGKEQRYDGTTTWRFVAESVSDVAWLAAEGYSLQTELVDDTTVILALPAVAAALAPRYFDVVAFSLRRFEQWLGPYPWPTLSIVVPISEAMGAGGMEYPALVTTPLPAAPAIGGIHDVEMVTAHELAHQWFPMQIATDEAREPWLDEAFAEYAAQRLMQERYGVDRSLLDLPFVRLGYDAQFQLGLAEALRLPITRRAWDYGQGDYGAAVYAKGGALLATLHRVYGEEAFAAALRSYVEQWRWRHPTSGDLRAALNAGLSHDSANPVDPWLDQLAFGDRLLRVLAVDVREDGATILRAGDAALPVEGVLRLDSGLSTIWRLEATEERLELVAPRGARIAALVADPKRDLVIAPHMITRASSSQPELPAIAGITARLVELAALALQVVVHLM